MEILSSAVDFKKTLQSGNVNGLRINGNSENLLSRKNFNQSWSLVRLCNEPYIIFLSKARILL